MSIRAVSTSALLALLLSAGCQPLNFERSFNVEGGDIQVVNFDPGRYGQNLKIQVSSPGAPVSVYLVRESDAQAAQQALEQGKTPASPLASKERAEDVSLEASIPAKTGYALLIRADKKAEVKVKVTGR